MFFGQRAMCVRTQVRANGELHNTLCCCPCWPRLALSVARPAWTVGWLGGVVCRLAAHSPIKNMGQRHRNCRQLHVSLATVSSGGG